MPGNPNALEAGTLACYCAALRDTELGHTTDSPGLDVDAQVEGGELTVPPMMHDPTQDKASS